MNEFLPLSDFTYIIDTLFILFSMTLIILMVPGFAMLEAGLVRTKNVSTVLTINTMIYAVASMSFLLFGYTHAYGSWENSSLSLYAAFMFQIIPASNIPLVVLGAFLLWIGWFGFNGGSVGSISTKEGADAVAMTIMNTNTSGLAGAIIAGLMMYIRYRKFDITMILNGALGGLVAVTAGPNLYAIYQPILIGFSRCREWISTNAGSKPILSTSASFNG
jgi:ammonia channel protein AmtB